MKVVCFFNHKGGVGKTTIVMNTAIALAAKGLRVVILDADAQANLTALALDADRMEELVQSNKTIWATVAPLVSGAGDFVALAPEQVRDHVWVLPGDIRLSNFEAICPTGWTESLAGEERGFRVSAAIHRLCQSFDELVGADFVLVDLGPNVGALNRTALLAADGFVVPVAPDLFSVLAMPSVGQSIRAWVTQWKTALTNKPAGLNFGLPKGSPRPLGYVSQQFSVYRKKASAAYQQWLDRLPEAYTTGIVEPLASVGIPAPGGEHQIASLPNFYSLVPIAQEANKAIFELSGTEARGAQFTKAQETTEVFGSIAQAIVDRLGA